MIYRLSEETRGLAWGTGIVGGVNSVLQRCPACMSGDIAPDCSEVLVSFDDAITGSRWPDLLGNGEYPLVIVSERVLDVLRGLGQTDVPCVPARCVDLPMKLRLLPQPRYFCIRTHEFEGAEVDLEASRLDDVVECPQCGSLTMPPASANKPDIQFILRSVSLKDKHLFVTRPFPQVPLATEQCVLAMARAGLKGIAAKPITEFWNSSNYGVTLTRKWRPEP